MRRSRGEGSLFFEEAKGLWVARITLPDGKRKSKYSKSKRDLKDWLLENRSLLSKGMLPKDEKITVGEFLDNYMETAKHNLRPKTFDTYQYLINSHINPIIGNIRLSALRPDHLQSLYNNKLEKGLSRRTVQFMHSIIHKSLAQAVKWEIIPRNVADVAESPRPSKRPPTIWTPEQVRIFLNSAKESKYYLLFLLAIYCGFRKSEVLGIHIEDIDLKRGTISVNHTVQIGKNGVYLSEPKTESSRRTVTVPGDALKELKEFVGRLNKDQGLLFVTSSGRPVAPPNIVKMFKREVVKAGLPKIRFHDLRHFHATALLLAGASMKQVQDRLGHSQISTSMDIYTHVLPAMRDDAADKFNKLIDLKLDPNS